MADLDVTNFLQQIKQIVTGTNAGQAVDGGYLVDIDVSNRLPSTLTSTATSTLSTLFITRDYDQTSDQAMLRLICSTSTAGNPTITGAASLTIWNPNTGTASTSSTAFQTSSTAFTTSTITNFGVDLSGNGLQYGDIVSVAISTSGGNLGIIGGSFSYSSVLVAWNDYGTPATTVNIQTGAVTGPNSVTTETINGSIYELRTR